MCALPTPSDGAIKIHLAIDKIIVRVRNCNLSSNILDNCKVVEVVILIGF